MKSDVLWNKFCRRVQEVKLQRHRCAPNKTQEWISLRTWKWIQLKHEAYRSWRRNHTAEQRQRLRAACTKAHRALRQDRVRRYENLATQATHYESLHNMQGLYDLMRPFIRRRTHALLGNLWDMKDVAKYFSALYNSTTDPPLPHQRPHRIPFDLGPVREQVSIPTEEWVIYTDGSCYENGTTAAIAGWVFFMHHSER